MQAPDQHKHSRYLYGHSRTWQYVCVNVHTGKVLTMPTPHPYTARDGTTTWRVRFRHEGRSTSETFHTKRAAEAFCADLAELGPARAVALRDQDDAREHSPTLDAVAEQWLAWKAGRVRSDRTVHDYRRDYARTISPVLGRRHVIDLTDRDVQALIDSLAGTLSPKTISDRHAILHGILAWAASPAGGKIIPSNPAVGTDLPKRLKPAPKALRPAEWDALHRALTAIDPHAADLALFLVSTGWRWSEAVALDPWSVDDDGVTVRVTMGRVLRRTGDNRFVLVDDAKAQASLRSVTLPLEAATMVRRRMATAHGLLFTTATGAQWHYSNFAQRAWRPAVDLANLNRRPSPHWLRHTHVVWMVRAGASLPELQSRIGHASISTTINVYGRGLTDVSPDALGRFGQMVTPPPAIS